MVSSNSVKQLKSKKIAILGLGKEGLSTLRFLKRLKIKSRVLDAKLNKNYLNKLQDFDLIFRTPGFPRLHPKLLAAEKNEVIVSSHIKLFFDLCPTKIVGITGTKGKTTTTSLIYQILKSKYGKKVFLAGNIGKPALDILPKLKKDSLVVFELSSFQLQDLHKSPHIAVITNITLDHLDPSGKFAPSTHQNAGEYFKAKMNIIKRQERGDFAILHPSLKAKTKNIGLGKKLFPTPLPFRTKLIGRHNLENIALAVEVGKIFRVPKEKMFKAVKTFKGVEHRLEFVAKINGVSFYNDSAATNPDATLAALKSFKEPIHPVRGRGALRALAASNGVHLILGGSDKGLDYKKLTKYISTNTKNAKSIALIGQIKNKLYKIISNKKARKFKNLKDAVLTLYKNAGKNEVVLLSPAAASFDMFSGYGERGEKFKKIVAGLGVKNARR
ncbi:MAG: UDP-N-acetylmuramoyl-L-alanine--D-glutamate ligase [Patescibacteria group bacterium]